MHTYAQVMSRKLHDGTRRYSFGTKVIAPGERSRWPGLSMDRFTTREEALAAAAARGWTVVKTWEEAEKLAGVFVCDSRYYEEGTDPWA